MTSRERVVTLPPGAKTQDSHKAVLGHLTDKDETRQPLPLPGSAHGLHDQGGSRDAFDAQSARHVPGTQPPWFSSAPLPAGAKRPAAAYLPFADAEFLDSLDEPVAAGSLAESTVRSTWRATDAPELAAGAAAIPVERAAHPSAVADHAPPSAGSKRAYPSDAFMCELDASTMANSSTSTTGAWLAGDQCRLRTSLAAQHGSVSSQAGTTRACGDPKGTLLNNLD
jgi:hypothetical protein